MQLTAAAPTSDPTAGVFFGANDTSVPPNPKVAPTGRFNHFGAFLRAT